MAATQLPTHTLEEALQYYGRVSELANTTNEDIKALDDKALTGLYREIQDILVGEYKSFVDAKSKAAGQSFLFTAFSTAAFMGLSTYVAPQAFAVPNTLIFYGGVFTALYCG
ncbi:MAG: hypothetical protein KDD04_10540, partial [Sinomicrobium sp.]|nr:hypothetical protein [Sinomicrobium sp.]